MTAIRKPARRIALVGNPNSGKTTLFNALTGLHQKVGNYPGITVEKKTGTLEAGEQLLQLIDLPGTYSLRAASEDERVVRDALLGQLEDEAPLDAVLMVIDATHLERQMFLLTQVAELGLPVVLALTMNDEAQRHGRPVNVKQLAKALALPVVAVHAARGTGLQALGQALATALSAPPEQRLQWAAASASRGELSIELDARQRFAWISRIVSGVQQAGSTALSVSDRVDRVLTHPFLGILVLAVVMGIVFQCVFTWAVPLMALIERGVGLTRGLISGLLPAGPLHDLLANGVVVGVGAVLMFLPQILLLFLFIAILEDSGYMARAALLMNKHMRRAGLQGRSFIPMMCGFGCAVPAIMATRTIPNKRDRLITMLVVPLVSCSARLPVYALMIAAFVPAVPLFGSFTAQGATLFAAYMLSLVAAITFAYIFGKTVLRGTPEPFVLELPPYRWPHWRTVLTTIWERGKLFVTQAGTIILAINIILWFLASFPHNARIAEHYDSLRAEVRRAPALTQDQRTLRLDALANEEAGANLRNSMAGRLGMALEPAIKPLGFDWKIGIGLVGSLAAREVFVSTMATVYNLGDAKGAAQPLVTAMRSDVDPRTGKPVFNLLVSLNLILFYILACQCMSTVAVVKRETKSWKWPLFLVSYMTVLAYVACLAVFQLGSRIWSM